MATNSVDRTPSRRPAAVLPIELREVGHVIFAYPRYRLDATRPAGAPLSSIRLTQRRTGASRGMRQTWLGWDSEERDTLEYLVHAGNKYLDLVKVLKEIAEAHDDHRVSTIRSIAIQALRAAEEIK